MDTIIEPIEDVRAPSLDGDQVDTFFRTLRVEQNRFLEVIGRCAASVAVDSPQLAQASAIQARLTRRFFDAQRAILQQRRAVDRSIGELGESLAAGPDTEGPRYERQLGAVLDQWWRAECDESKALVDDAQARAEVRRHLEQLHEAGVPSAAVPAELRMVPTPPSVSVGALPGDVVGRLGACDGPSLHSTLDALLADLAPSAPVAGEPVLRFEPAGPVSQVDDPFQRFWTSSAPAAHQEFPASERPLGWRSITTRVLAPIAAITVALTALMAWIG